MNTTPNLTSGRQSPSQSSDGPEWQSPGPRRAEPKRRLLRSLIATLIIVSIGLVVSFYHFEITDYLSAHVFSPPSGEVVQLADKLDLTERGRDIFYASHPTIQDSSATFPCQSGEGGSVILGCYASQGGFYGNGIIYVLSVKNSALEGVVQVTAAHEMLHATYARLNDFEKPHVDKMVLAEYNKIKDKPEIKEQMGYYNLAEPGQNINELHSIIGTTIASLDPDLESYYSHYFSDREAIVTHYESYFQALHKNDEQIASLKAKIDAELASLQSDAGRYKTDLTQLNLDIQSFNQRANSGGFSSRSSFDAARSAIVARVNTMNRRAEDLNGRVSAYNADIVEINSLSAQTNDLYTSLKGVQAPSGI